MDASQDFKSLQDNVSSALVAATKSAAGIAREDLSFLRTIDTSVASKLDKNSSRLLRLAEDLLKSAGRFHGQQAPSLDDADDVDINWRGIVDVLDTLLEKADTCLDEYTGLVKRKDAPTTEAGRLSKKPKSTSDRLEWSMKRANIIKPQNAFERKVDNFDTGAFKPLLTSKPHATVPLDESLITYVDDFSNPQYAQTYDLISLYITPRNVKDSAAATLTGNTTTSAAAQQSKQQNLENTSGSSVADGKGTASTHTATQQSPPEQNPEPPVKISTIGYKHPYEAEIQQLEYPKQIFEKRKPIPYLDVEKTNAVWVDTYEGVLEMLGELKKAKEIAVDLEHHDYRTYPGLLSLMQISTREKDWIVDTLRPWRHKLEVLNEVFADPKIIKVFHGAFMDIIWLQRDLGLYIVGMFDTFCACDALNYQGKSLAYLLKKFVDFDADKKYQMADWRIRPIPEEMLYYARSDTHYLLYIFDMVRNEILNSDHRVDPAKSLMETILEKSKDVSLLRYETLLCDEETGTGSRGWYNNLVKGSGAYNAEQFSVYKAVWKWRDDLARKEDESPYFIMHPSAIGDIARVGPEDPKALWSLLGNASQPVKTHLDELFSVVQAAKQRGATGPTMLEFFRGHTSVGSVARRVFGDRKPKSKVPEIAVPDISLLKAEKSQVFGDMPISSRWEATGKTAKDDLHIALPWTAYVQNQALADAAMAEPPVEKEDVDMIPLEPEAPISIMEDDGFTLKQGRKRKAREAELPSEPVEDSVVDDEPSAPASDIELVDDDEDTQKSSKKRKLKSKKERLAAKAAGREDVEMENGSDEQDEQAFDYTQAQSVLHANGNPSDRPRRKKKEKVFDPYTAKTESSMKGARKMNFEKTGKTATFK